MKRAMMLSFILILLLTTAAFQNPLAVEGETQDVGYTIKMKVTYSNPVNGTRIWNLTEEDRTIGLFMNNTWQTVWLIDHSYPLEMTTTDEDGNPIAVLQFPISELNPGEDMTYTVTYRALSKPRSLPKITEEESGTVESIPNDLSERYCKEEGPWLVNDPTLQNLTHNIAGNKTKVLTIVKEFILWIRDNIKYNLHGLLPYYPNQTYSERQGDCDDQANLFITLCRIFGIPSYTQLGCIYLPTELTNETFWDGHVTLVYKRIGYHGWAVVYVPPWGWLPVDLTYVIAGLADPLNAIRRAAVVTFQEVIQCMNYTKTDYVASYKRTMEFLQDNDFYIHSEDEMILEPSPEPPKPSKPPEPPSDEVQGKPRLISVLIFTAAVGVTLTGASMIVFVLCVRKAKKEKLRQ